MRNSSPSCRPCRWAIAVGISKWHAGTVCGLDVAGTLLAVERADQQLDLARPAEQKEPVTAAGDVHGRQAGDDRDDRLRPCHLGVQPVDCLDRQPAAYVRGHLDHPYVGGVGERRAERVERTRELEFEYQDPRTTVTPTATPITLSSVRRQSAINAAR